MCAKVLVYLSMMICIRYKHVQVSLEQAPPALPCSFLILTLTSHSSSWVFLLPALVQFPNTVCLPNNSFLCALLWDNNAVFLLQRCQISSLHYITIIQSLAQPVLCQNVTFIKVARNDLHRIYLSKASDSEKELRQHYFFHLQLLQIILCLHLGKKSRQILN